MSLLPSDDKMFDFLQHWKYIHYDIHYHKYIVMAPIALKNNEIPRRLRLIRIHSYCVLLEAVG